MTRCKLGLLPWLMASPFPCALIVEHPYDVGSFARYTDKTTEVKDMRQTNLKMIGCRHCLYRSPGLENARSSQNGDNNRCKRFTLDGSSPMRKRSRVQSFFRGHVLKEHYVILDLRYFPWMTTRRILARSASKFPEELRAAAERRRCSSNLEYAVVELFTVSSTVSSE